MFKIGLCSVTFRQLSVEEIIELSAQAGIDGIEWGGDVHVEPGDYKRAEEVAKMTEQAHMRVASFGSYYKAGNHKQNKHSFEEVLKTAKCLKAPAIRVWAGSEGSEEASVDYKEAIIEDAKRIGDMAQVENISVHFEAHRGSLTDTAEASETLMQAINHPNVFIYWQPAVDEPVESRVETIQKTMPWLSHVHVFHWHITDRLPLSEGKNEWTTYLKQLASDKVTRYLLLEFVKENDSQQFLKDVKTLKEIVNMAN